jgi:hypothetical protein
MHVCNSTGPPTTMTGITGGAYHLQGRRFIAVHGRPIPQPQMVRSAHSRLPHFAHNHNSPLPPLQKVINAADYVSSTFSFSLGRRIFLRPFRTFISTFTPSHFDSSSPFLQLFSFFPSAHFFLLQLHHTRSKSFLTHTQACLPCLLTLRSSRLATEQCRHLLDMRLTTLQLLLPIWMPWLNPSGCRCPRTAL